MTRVSDPLWPVLLLLLVLLGGTGVLEVVARNREAAVTTIQVSGAGTATTSERDDGEEDTLDLGEVAPVSAEHAQARMTARRGEVDQALTELEAVRQKHPKAAIVHADYGYWLIKAGRAKEAVAALERAAELAPNSALIALNLGAARRQNHDLDGAESAFRTALRLKPGYGSARRALAQLLRKRGDAKAAIQLLRQAAASGDNAERALALVSLGQTYLDGGKPDRAQRAFAEAVDRAPADVRLRVRIARSWLRTSRPEHLAAATEQAQRAAALAPDDADVQALLARTKERAGDRPGARAGYQRALRLDPNQDYARRRLIRLALRRDDYAEARRHARELVTRGPDVAQHQFLAALVAARAGQTEEARQQYANAIARADGNYPEAYFNLGLLEKHAGNLDAAIQAYESALSTRPGYLEARNNLGLALAASGRTEEAAAAYLAATKRQPKYAPAWKNLAELYMQTKRSAEAVAALEKALAARPGNAQIQLDLGQAQTRSKQYAVAAQTYRHLLASEPRNARAWHGLSRALAAGQDLAGAQDALEKALALAPDESAYLRDQADLAVRAGKLDEARRTYQNLLDHAPGDAGARLALAEVLRRAGSVAECEREAARVVRVDPGNADAKDLQRNCAALAAAQ